MIERLRIRRSLCTSAAILAISALSFTSCTEGASQTPDARPTIEDCGKLGEGERCPKACFAPSVEAATIKYYTPHLTPSELQVRASRSDQELLSEQFTNGIGPRKITLRPRKADGDTSPPTSVKSALPTDHPHLHVGENGVTVSVGGEALPPIDACPQDGPTVCLRDRDLAVVKRAAEAASLARNRTSAKAATTTDSILGAYDWRGVYNVLMTVKESRPDSSFLVISAHHDLPYAVLVRAADVARVQLEEPAYDTTQAFRDAKPKRPSGASEDRRVALFPRPIFSSD